MFALQKVPGGLCFLGPTSVWLRSCGTAGKPGGNRENKLQPAVSGVTGLLDQFTGAEADGG